MALGTMVCLKDTWKYYDDIEYRYTDINMLFFDLYDFYYHVFRAD